MQTTSRSHVAKALAGAVTSLALGALAVACGGSDRASTPPSATFVKHCDALCDKGKACSTPAKAEGCRSRCESSEVLRKLEAFKSEASEPMWDCLTASICEPDHEATGKRCVHDVATKLPRSPKVESLCATLEDAFASCGAPWASPCTEELRPFADADLDGFSECVDRSCKSGVACFRSAEHALLSKPH